MNNQSIIRPAISFMKAPTIYVFFVVVYIGSSISYVSDKFGFYNTLKISVLFASVQGVVAVFNTKYNAQKYLFKNKVVPFALLLIGSIALCVPIIKSGIALFFGNIPEIYNYYMVEKTFIFYFVDSSIAVAGVSAIYYVHKLIEMNEKTAIIEKQQLETELKYLKAQINPHFLFNILNSIYALSLKKSDKTPTAVLKLSEIMRHMLYDSHEKTVSLAKEIAYINNYIELQRLRHANNIDITFVVNSSIQQQKIAPMLLLPFVENSFKHGLSNQIEQPFIFIELLVEKNDLFFNVKNSQALKSDCQKNVPKEERSSSGIGLPNVKRRLQLVYPDSHTLRILEKENVYEVDLHIQLDT